MSRRLKPHKTAARDVRETALDGLVKAREALSLPPAQQAEGVHLARKRFKELRALLRLVRAPLGKDFTAYNQAIRNAARQLADLRDATALVESWDALAGTSPGLLPAPAMGRIRQRLYDRASGQKAEPLAGRPSLDEVIDRLREVEAGVAGWSLRGRGFGLYAPGLERTYKDGRKALQVAERIPDAHHLHEWRKRVKDHWYQTRLLADAWPAELKARADSLKVLSDTLGDDHDLFMLGTLLREQPGLFGPPAHRRTLATAVEARRTALRDRALSLGRKLYAESPGALRERWRRYWKLARQEKRAPR